MSKDPFPEHADTSKLFARNGSISAVLPLRELSRLASTLMEPLADVQVQLQFGHDEEGRRRLQGSLGAEITQLCQRCLQPLVQTLECTLDLLVLDSEAALADLSDADAAAMDVLVDEADALDLRALIEDELLLSLPLAPMHADLNCSAVLNALRQQAEAADRAVSQQANPFAVLAGLKNSDGSKDPGR